MGCVRQMPQGSIETVAKGETRVDNMAVVERKTAFDTNRCGWAKGYRLSETAPQKAQPEDKRTSLKTQHREKPADRQSITEGR